MDYDGLVIALEARYKERRTMTSYLAELESRKLGQNEKLSEYVCELKNVWSLKDSLRQMALPEMQSACGIS